MGTLYAMMAISGWAFFIGLLGYLIWHARPGRRGRDRSRGFDVVVKDDGSKVS